MDQRFGQVFEFPDNPRRPRHAGTCRQPLACSFRPDDARSSTPTRSAAELATTETDIDIPDLRLGLERAWVLILDSQIDRALTALEAIERRLDDLSPPAANRYRAATEVLRLAVVAFQDDNLAVLAIVLAQGLVGRGAGLGMLLSEAKGRSEPLEPTDDRPSSFVRSAGKGATQSGSSTGDAITGRERDVLAMIGEGYSNKRIARTLEISPETVKSHVKHIFSKLAVSKRSEAVSKAVVLRLL